MRGDTSRVRLRDKDENPFSGRDRGKFKIIGRPPVDELRPTRETRLPKPDFRPDRKSMPPQKFEKPASFIKERKAARTPGESVFKPGRAPRDIQDLGRINIPKEQRKPKLLRIRDEKPRLEKGPVIEILPGVTEKEKKRGNDIRIERERTVAPVTAPETVKDNGRIDERKKDTTEDLRRTLPSDRNIHKDDGNAVPSVRTTTPPANRVNGSQPDMRIQGGGEQTMKEPGFRRDKQRPMEQEKDVKQKQKKVKDPKGQKDKEEKKGDKDKEDAPR